MQSKIAMAGLVLILIVINWSINNKEKHLREGQIVYLQLAPVDPRSLMQGDYMALRFAISNDVYKALQQPEANNTDHKNLNSADGHIVVSLDENKIATFKNIYDQQILTTNEILLQFRVRDDMVKFATNAFFFQEGHGKDYQPARFGQFRVDDSGELLLVAMYDKDLNKLIPHND